MEATLRRHDRIALSERRRRNVIPDLSFGSGCRCCYDTNDGGEYTALIELQKSMEQGKQTNGNDEIDYSGRDEENNDDKESNQDNYDGRSDDSDFDYLLDEDLPEGGGGGAMDNELKLLQQERLQELQLSALIRESAMQHGFGVHRQFHPQRVLHAAGLGLEGNQFLTGSTAIPPAAVIHLNEDTV